MWFFFLFGFFFSKCRKTCPPSTLTHVIHGFCFNSRKHAKLSFFFLWIVKINSSSVTYSRFPNNRATCIVILMFKSWSREKLSRTILYVIDNEWHNLLWNNKWIKMISKLKNLSLCIFVFVMYLVNVCTLKVIATYLVSHAAKLAKNIQRDRYSMKPLLRKSEKLEWVGRSSWNWCRNYILYGLWV